MVLVDEIRQYFGKTVPPAPAHLDLNHDGIIDIFDLVLAGQAGAEFPPSEPYVPPAAPTGCFIATATFGTPLAPQIGVLRKFRDECLPPLFVRFYYRVSPPMANYISRHSTARDLSRRLLEPLIKVFGKLQK